MSEIIVNKEKNIVLKIGDKFVSANKIITIIRQVNDCIEIDINNGGYALLTKSDVEVLLFSKWTPYTIAVDEAIYQIMDDIDKNTTVPTHFTNKAQIMKNQSLRELEARLIDIMQEIDDSIEKLQNDKKAVERERLIIYNQIT